MTDGFIFDFQRFRHWMKSSKKRFILTLSCLAIVFSFVSAPSVAQTSTVDTVVNVASDLFFGASEPFEVRKANSRAILDNLGCFSCNLFSGFATAVFDTTDRVDKSGVSLIPALVGFTTAFTFFYMGSAFVAGDASDLTSRWQIIWRLYLAATAASIFLTSPLTYSWDYIFGPLFSIGTGIINIMGGLNSAGCAANSITTGAPQGANAVLSEMSLTICGAFNMTKDGIATGMALTSQGGGPLFAIVNAIAGLMVILIYGYIAVIFPLRFIDVIIRLALVGMLTPILGLLAVFKPTRGYVAIAVSNVLNATFQFAITAVMFIIGQQVFENFLAENSVSIDSTGILSNPISVLMNAFIIVGIAFVFSGMLKSVPGIAAEFARYSGSNSDIAGGAVGKFAAAGATVATGGGAAAKIVASKAVSRLGKSAS